MRSILLIAILTLVACTTTPEKSDRKWAVQVKDAQLVGNSAYIPHFEDATKTQAAAPVPPKLAEKLWVWHADGSKQCGKAKGIDPGRLANAIRKRGVGVSKFRTAMDGGKHSLLCGAPTGKIIELEISAKDLPKAKKLGLLEKAQGN